MESNTDSDFEEEEMDGGTENSRVYENLVESDPLYENMEALTLENPSLRWKPTRRTEMKGSHQLVGRMQERLETLREAQITSQIIKKVLIYGCFCSKKTR